VAVTDRDPARPEWLNPTLYPFDARWFDSSSGRLHYVDEGEGRPVVMLHGNPTWSFQYRTVIADLCDRRRCIAPDQLGFGLSDKPTAYSYLPVDQARIFAEFMDALDLHDVTLVVGDWGGPVGLSWVLDNIDRVASLVITNTWMWSVRDDWYYQGFSRFMGGPIGRTLIQRRNFFAGSFLKRVYGDSSRLTPEIHQHYLAALATPDDRRGSAVFPREIIGSSDWLSSLWARRSALASLDITLAWGMKDIAFREKELDRWRDAFPKARVVRYADCGHYVAEEKPHELADEILSASL
jgi:haloalkane dehalogenase